MWFSSSSAMDGNGSTVDDAWFNVSSSSGSEEGGEQPGDGDGGDVGDGGTTTSAASPSCISSSDLDDILFLVALHVAALVLLS
jgi:hypothetical protein